MGDCTVMGSFIYEKFHLLKTFLKSSLTSFVLFEQLVLFIIILVVL